MIGALVSSCPLAEAKKATGDEKCQGIISALKDTNPKPAMVTGRLVFNSGAAAVTIVAAEETITGAKASTGDKLYIAGANPDLLLASLYQSNDATANASTSSTGTKWCVGAWSNSLASDVAVKVMKGLTAKTKCSFQFIANASTKAPAFELSGSVLAHTFMIQAVEWTDSAKLDSYTTLGSWSNTELTAAPFYMASANDKYTAGNSVAVSSGITGAVYFNPVKAKHANENAALKVNPDDKYGLVANT